MGAPELEVKMVEAMYENTTGRVVVGSGMSNEFQVNIGLRQGSALTPLLFILVMELISRKISTTDALREIIYADDLVIVAEHREELQGALEEWNNWIRRIAGVKRVERRRMNDLREEVGTKACIVGNMVRMKDERLLKRSGTKKQEGCRKRGRPQLKWEDCARSEKRIGGRKVERKGQQQRSMETNYKSSHTAEWQLDQPYPYKRETRGRIYIATDTRALDYSYKLWQVRWNVSRKMSGESSLSVCASLRASCRSRSL